MHQATKSLCPPPWNQRGGGQHSTHLRVRGRGEPIRTIGEKAWHSIYCGVLHRKSFWLADF
jgi:hypothetical protein